MTCRLEAENRHYAGWWLRVKNKNLNDREHPPLTSAVLFSNTLIKFCLSHKERVKVS
jgi:hypothetical protein